MGSQPSKCTHTRSSGQPTLRHSGSSRGFGALLKGLISVMDNSCQSRDSKPQPWVTSPTLYPLEPRLTLTRKTFSSERRYRGNSYVLLFISTICCQNVYLQINSVCLPYFCSDQCFFYINRSMENRLPCYQKC